MHIREETLDDVLHVVFQRALRNKNRTRSSKGSARELIAALVTIKNPRARFSRTERRGTLLSCLGESLWYLSGSDRLDVIEHYIPKYRTFSGISKRAKTAPGAYGPRLFGKKAPTQYERVVDHLAERLKDGKDTRQAVVQVFREKDLGKKDVPCTCTLQFLARRGRLHMMTSMRSNDAYRGLPHDVFAFTWLQEIVARSVSLELGEYHHAVGSLHLYDADEDGAREYLGEGWPERLAMPAMPSGDPWPSIRWLLGAEEAIRLGRPYALEGTAIAPYWVDLARLLRFHRLLKEGRRREIVQEKSMMSTDVYEALLRSKSQVRDVEGDAPLLAYAAPAGSAGRQDR
jgi:thymidylate synthase